MLEKLVLEKMNDAKAIIALVPRKTGKTTLHAEILKEMFEKSAVISNLI